MLFLNAPIRSLIYGGSRSQCFAQVLPSIGCFLVAGKGIAVSVADVLTAILEIKPESHKRNNKEAIEALEQLGYTKKRINNKTFSGYFYVSNGSTDPCILKLNRASGAVNLDGSKLATTAEQKAHRERE